VSIEEVETVEGKGGEGWERREEKRGEKNLGRESELVVGQNGRRS
jgi:hypothetical protein